MNYISLIRRFWQIDMERPISPSDTRLYFYLLETCNSLGWKNPFGHSDRYLAARLGMSVNTVRDSRVRLKQMNLIDFTSPEQGSKALNGQMQYKIIETVSKFDTVTDTVSDTVTDTVIDTVSDTNNKLKETKQNLKESAKMRPEKKEISEASRNLNAWAKEFFNPKYLGDKSAQCFDLLLKDYTAELIKTSILNARKDQFWNQNFLSPVKLRQKDRSGAYYIDLFLGLKPKKAEGYVGQILEPTDERRQKLVNDW